MKTSSLFLTSLCLLLPLAAGPGHSLGDDVGHDDSDGRNALSRRQSKGGPFEPAVSQREAKILREALTLEDVSEAIDLIRAGLNKDSSPAMYFALGNLLFQQEELEQATQAYEQAVRIMPHFRDALMNLGRLYLLQDRPEDTIDVYQDLVRDGEANADILLLLGHSMLMTDEPVGAEEAYRQALLLRPRKTEIRIGLAKALLTQERYQEGLGLVEEILLREPLNRELWDLRVNALLSSGEIDKAILTIEQAARLDRASPELLATQGDLWLNSDRPKDAIASYRKAFSVREPSAARMLRALEGFIFVEDSPGANEMIKGLHSVSNDTLEPEQQILFLRLQARLARQRDDLEEAIRLSEALLERDPLDGQTLLLLSELEMATGASDLALLNAERAARLPGFEADALLLQARIEVAQGNYGRAVPLLESAQAFEPKDHVGRYLEQVRRLAR